MNLNPIRVGLSLFKTFDDIQKRFGYSLFVTNEMKGRVIDIVMKILEIFTDPEEIIPLMESLDIEGRDTFWYFQKYKLYGLLNVKIMDKFMS